MNLRAPAVMLASGLSLYAGAALAVKLFDAFPPAVVAWLRMAAAGVVLLVVMRPKIQDFCGRAGFMAALFGCVTMGMNMSFYEAIAQLPLGTAVSIEFLGPIAVAAWGSRSVRDWVALLLAGGGVLLMSGAQWQASRQGIIFALAAATLWALYIVLGARTAKAPQGTRQATPQARLAVGFSYAAVLGSPVALAWWPEVQPGGGIAIPMLVGLAFGLGVLSAAIPYSLDQVVLRMAGPKNFALLLALLPLTAALLGFVMLGQGLSLPEALGIAAVVVAVTLNK